MGCPDRLADLEKLADRELATGAERALRRHVTRCEDCRSTLDLLLVENRAIAGALAPALPTNERSHARRLVAAAAALLLIGGAFYALQLLYEETGSAARRVADRAAQSLQVPVKIRAEEMPLEDFLAEVSEISGVNVQLASVARQRTSTEPLVSITLASPIALRSLLELVTEFYGLTPEVGPAGVTLK